MILILVALLCQDPSAEVDSLIRDLGHDLIEVRERAQRGLVRIGCPALPALRTAMATLDAETRARSRALILHLDREERERDHDSRELATLLDMQRPANPLQWEGKAHKAVTEGARFSLDAVRRKGGMVILTEYESFLQRDDVKMDDFTDIQFDVSRVEDLDGRELAVERCDRCSPGRVFVKGHDGPLRVKVTGVQMWFSRYEVTFDEPQDGQTRRVGDMTIEVAWPVLKVTSKQGWPFPLYDRNRDGFNYEMKPGRRSEPPWRRCRSGFGAIRMLPSPMCADWCDQANVPFEPDIAFTLKDRFHEMLLRSDCYGVPVGDVGSIQCTIWKPVEIPFEFTIELRPEKEEPPR